LLPPEILISKFGEKLGNFAYSAACVTSAKGVTTIENKLVKKIANKVYCRSYFKNFERFKKGSGELVKLVKD
jgi:YidC/Oxa1 family membrane protein insertase